MREEILENEKLNLNEFRAQKTILKSKPTKAWLSISGKCNLKCKHCPGRVYGSDYLYEDVMSPELFTRIENELFPTLKDCRIGGNNLGEQLLPKEWDGYFERMVQHGFKINLITNGHALTRERVEKLVASGSFIDISIDGASDEIYKERRGASLSRLKERVGWIVEERNSRKGSRTRIRFSFTAMQQNIHELPDLVRLARELGVDEVMGMQFIPSDETQRIQSLFYHQSTANRNFIEAARIAEESGINIILPVLYEIPKLSESLMQASGTPKLPVEGRCLHPWSSMSITEKGEVFPCCVSEFLLGDLKKSSIAEIWNNDRFQKLRSTVNSSRPLRDCRNCVLRGHDFTRVDYENPEVFLKVINLTASEALKKTVQNNIKNMLMRNKITGNAWGRLRKIYNHVSGGRE